ncbi:MAG: glycosyltransferase [Dysgonomonas sp.]
MPERLFKHIIITRFNIKVRYKGADKPFEQTEEWLRTRFNLFETYCFPSLKQQTNKDFVWLCLFDIDTPTVFKEKISNYTEGFSQFAPVYLSECEANDISVALAKYVKEYADGYKYVYTTRIDNDDSFHCLAVEVLQSAFTETDVKTVLSFNYGYQYFEKYNFVLKMFYPNNHFLSLIEKTDGDVNTILAYNHTKIRKEESCIDIQTRKPYWVEVVHGSNVNNQLMLSPKYKYKPIFRTISFREFGFDHTILPRQSIASFVLHFIPYTMKLSVKEIYRKIRKRKR